MDFHNYYVYIITNPKQSVWYIGVTNNLVRRLEEHYRNRGNKKTFAGKYYCYNLLYFQHFKYINNAIDYEKELKELSREQKENIINEFNPERKFLNVEVGHNIPFL
jgi:putative endonuclease